MRYRFVGWALVAVAIAALVGCSGTSGGSAAPSVAGAPPTTAASSAPSEAAPSEAVASEPAPSEAVPLPSFAFPSTDKELEALLPGKLCGVSVQKISMSAETFGDADPEFLAILAGLGKTADDVTLAIAASLDPKVPCSAGIFRIKGVDSNKFKEVFLAQSAKDGQTFEERSIGGKTVLYDKDSDSFQYAYFKGDAVIFAQAKDDAQAAEVLSALP